jgi:hypothetical protein
VLQWKPKLDACLHDQHVFVLGLKRDLRPAYPTLGLSFLPTKERATAEMVSFVCPQVSALAYTSSLSPTFSLSLTPLSVPYPTSHASFLRHG